MIRPFSAIASRLAAKYGLNRTEVDAVALRSQQGARTGWEDGSLAQEVVPVPVANPRTRETIPFDRDEHPRTDTTAEGLARLAPYFRKDGLVTAGNASQFSDGASVTLLMSAEKAKSLGVTPLGLLRGFQVAGCRPEEMGIGPVFAVPRLLERHGLRMDDIDLWELNEAFAAVVLRYLQILKMPHDRINVNGGAIAMGHPLGATGAMILGTLLDEMERRGLGTGLATLCIGAGMGTATIIERV